MRLALIGRTFRKLQSETDWWRPVHSVWAHSNAGDDVSHSSCEIFFPSKSWDIEAVGCCCAGPIIILFQLVDSVSRFLSEKLQNNKIQLRKSFFSTRVLLFITETPFFLQLRQLVRSFTDFYFLSLVDVSFLPPWPAPHRESGYSADRTRLSLVHSLRLRFTLWESLPETPKID